jgi:hypothetical protein
MATVNSSIARHQISELAPSDVEAIKRLKQAIVQGKHWYLALLEAVKAWDSTEEDYDGRHYRYLIADEAFDWLLLAQRLCEEVSELIPHKELINLLLFDQQPIELTKDEFEELIGNAKYRAYLNYLYGIFMERLLVLTIAEEIRKRRRAAGLINDGNTINEAYQYLYGESEQELAQQFKREKRYPRSSSMNLSELNEFTYWLFKKRLVRNDKSRVASDTKKALLSLCHYLEQKRERLKNEAEKSPSSPAQAYL